jgi:hypothetical protein
VILLGTLGSVNGSAQGQKKVEVRRKTESITGVVTDPSGAVVRGATVMLMSGKDPSRVVEQTYTGRMGGYQISAAAGSYTVVVEAAGFARFLSQPVRLGEVAGSGEPRTLDIMLYLPTVVEKVEVPDEIFTSSSDFSGHSAILGRRDVEQMPLDPTALLDELQGLAGGPNAELYVSGFSGGQLPPRDSIGNIRIRQDAYSAQYDTDPGNGIIEVSTRPGTTELHGELYLYGDDSALNAGNPFAPDQPGYYADGSGGSLSGPIHHSATYFAGWDQMELAMNSAIDAEALDANLNQTLVNYAVRTPKSSVNASSRLDVRPARNSTLTARYALDREGQTNGGIGQLALASQGFSNDTTTQTLQIANTAAIGTKIVNDTRFQYIRARAEQTPVSTAPAIVVEGAVLDGGNDMGSFSDHHDHYELQDYASLAEGHHYLSVGGRLRVERDANESLANFSGQYIFSTLDAYQATKQGIAANESFTQIQAAGGGASQFSLNAGVAAAAVTIADAGIFAEDNWKVRPNLTLSYGLRFETQTYIADHADWAPRIGFSWSPGNGSKAGAKGPPTYVLHGGVGIFYRRFTSTNALLAERQNGTTQQEYVVQLPQFCPGVMSSNATGCPGVPSLPQLAAEAGAPTIYGVSPRFHAPYYIGETVGLDRRLGHFGTASVAYLDNRGVHTQLTENVNAPLPGTYNPANPASGVRPNGTNENIYQFVSEGVYRSNRLTTNVTMRTKRVTVYGYYTLRFEKSDAESDGVFPSNEYDLGADYGRSLDDVRHTATIGESARLPYGLETSGYLRALSGAPFNIVLGEDSNGDTQFNDRPAFATDLTRPSVVVTKWGTFDSSPIAGQKIIPRDYGQGPGLFVVNLAIGKSFGVGPREDSAKTTAKGPLPRKVTMEFWAESENLLNHPNLAPPVGTLNSPLFGRSQGAEGGSSVSPLRVVNLQLSARF